ncbi:hypothetical protein CEXT_324491 [Caerostris extrusa]|uniref:Uncharacterized protein n=1 Tax=Caerostris extrusa TaxID=172846 RepID=A0AAV4NVU9_CAEEX|nr:hypothetical protein CEXT_324491 [Caerostris extrusa]
MPKGTSLMKIVMVELFFIRRLLSSVDYTTTFVVATDNVSWVASIENLSEPLCLSTAEASRQILSYRVASDTIMKIYIPAADVL